MYSQHLSLSRGLLGLLLDETLKADKHLWDYTQRNDVEKGVDVIAIPLDHDSTGRTFCCDSFLSHRPGHSHIMAQCVQLDGA
jgi:hypothetical protein